MNNNVFALGDSYGYYFGCPSQQRYGILPRYFQQLQADNKVDHVYCAAFGEDSSYVVSYNDPNRGTSLAISPNLPPSLSNWIKKRDTNGRLVRQLETLSVTLGPKNESWYVTDGQDFDWDNLPAALDVDLNGMLSSCGQYWSVMPRIVALGHKGDYVLIRDSGIASWQLENYPVLDNLLSQLKEGGMHFDNIQTITLDPRRKHYFVLQYRNGSISTFNMPPHVHEAIRYIESTSIELVARQETSSEGIEAQRASIQIVRQLHEDISLAYVQSKQIKRDKQKKAWKYAGRGLAIIAALFATAAAVHKFGGQHDFPNMIAGLGESITGKAATSNTGSNKAQVQAVPQYSDVRSDTGEEATTTVSQASQASNASQELQESSPPPPPPSPPTFSPSAAPSTASSTAAAGPKGVTLEDIQAVGNVNPQMGLAMSNLYWGPKLGVSSLFVG